MRKLFSRRSFLLGRVDLQVTIFMTVIVFVLTLCCGLIFYNVTYNSAIKILTQRVTAIYNFLDKSFYQTFEEVQTKEDMDKPVYIEAKKTMENIRNVTNTMYLYTAKKNDDGEFVYVIDGLDESQDFRYPNDLIEPEIIPDLERALSGETVLPKDIKKTDWGEIFIAYFPLHNEAGGIVGVIGVEIDAHEQYATYRSLRITIPILILVFCTLSFVFATFFFRRISNPSYQNMINTDQLTKLKSRNSFEVFFKNLMSQNMHEKISLIVSDLDNLKDVNDAIGHSYGDEYITAAADAISSIRSDNIIPYRIGGDEFALIILDNSNVDIAQLINDISSYYEDNSYACPVRTGISLGYASFDNKLDVTLADTYKRADINMYENKRARKAKKQ